MEEARSAGGRGAVCGEPEARQRSEDRPARFRNVEPERAELLVHQAGLTELVEFAARIEADARLTQTVVPVGAGLRVAVLERTGA